MSNNVIPLDFGSVDSATKPPVHPEVQRRHNEIVQLMRELSDEEHIDALFAFASAKWHRHNSANESMKAENGDDKIN